MRRASWTLSRRGSSPHSAFPPQRARRRWSSTRTAPDQCSGTAPQCQTLTAASGAASSGDTVEVRPGYYPEKPTFGQANITITGTGSGLALVVGQLTLSNAGDVSISRLVLQSADDTPLVVGSGTIPLAHSITVEGTSLLTAKPVPALSVNVPNP